jgi:hypothetical protein
MVEVFGAFTRALRDADLEKCEEYLRRHPGRKRQGIVPDLQIDTALYELKGIRLANFAHLDHQSDSVKKQNAIRKPSARNDQIRGLFGSVFFSDTRTSEWPIWP